MTTETAAAKSTFCVVYRVGGTTNFQWKRSLGMSKSEAIEAKASTERMGYKAMVVNYALSLAIGLPETYE